MHRRAALQTIASLAAHRLTGRQPVRTAASSSEPVERTGLRITRVTGFRLVSERPKLVGKNSHLDVHGRTGSDFVWRVETNSEHVGLGVAPDSRAIAVQLLGKDPAEFYQPAARHIDSPLGRGDMPLWDLVAKLQGKPAYALFGGQGPTRVSVYDGSIYFADLLPEYEGRGIERILEEIDQGLGRGHRAFKVKIGRGWKWMPRAEGDRRDIAVLQAIRKHVGPDVPILVDANNGYDLNGTKRLFESVGPLDLGFAEEMFPETVAEDIEFRRFLKDRGWSTLVADGESARTPDHFVDYVKARALDIVQPDMRAFGFTLQLEMDRMLAGSGIRLAPHNWGSLVGFYMQLHLGRGIASFFRAEHDPLTTDVLVADGYQIQAGSVAVPDAPGFGLTLNPVAFQRKIKPAWEVAA